MELLVIRMSAMGDVAMTIPVVDSFLQQNPKVNVTFVTNPKFIGFFPSRENLRVFGADTKNEYKGLGGIIKLFRRLKAERNYDIVLDLHDVLRSKVLRALFGLCGVPVYCIDKGRREKKALTRRENKVFRQLESSVDRYKNVFDKAGFKFDVTFKCLSNLDKNITQPIRDFLGEKHCKWIAVAPFAQHKGKIYPETQMKTVVSRLAKYPVKIILFGGGKTESVVMEEWSRMGDNISSMAGKFNMAEELSVMSECDVMLSMDSSNMHLASLAGVPVVSIWGATHPYAGFYGFGQNMDNAIQLDMPCRPCSVYGNKPCARGDYACMGNIDPEIVVSKLLSLLSIASD